MNRSIIENVCPLAISATSAQPSKFMACLDAWLPYFRHYVISGDCELDSKISYAIASDTRDWHSCPPKVFNGLKWVVSNKRQCDWVLVLDDDTFVNDINLRKLIPLLDPRRRAIYGCDMKGHWIFGRKPIPFLSGGAGTLVPMFVAIEIAEKMKTKEWEWLPQPSKVWAECGGLGNCEKVGGGVIPDDAGADNKLGWYAHHNQIEQVNLKELFRPEGPAHYKLENKDILNKVAYHRQGPKGQSQLKEILNQFGSESKIDEAYVKSMVS